MPRMRLDAHRNDGHALNFLETCSQQEGLVERAAGRTRVACLEGLRYIAILSFDNKYLHAKRSNFCRRFVGRRFLERAARTTG